MCELVDLCFPCSLVRSDQLGSTTRTEVASRITPYSYVILYSTKKKVVVASKAVDLLSCH